MRPHEQLDIEALFEGLQPITDQAGPRVGLTGRKRLDHRLATRAEGVEVDIEIVLGVEALRYAEAEGRMAGCDVAPEEANFRSWAGDRRGEHAAAEHARCAGDS